MNERFIMDGAGDAWAVEHAASLGEGALLRCRHELGYELIFTTDVPLASLDDQALVSALEEARRRVPRATLSEAA